MPIRRRDDSARSFCDAWKTIGLIGSERKKPTERLDEDREANLADPTMPHDVFEVAWARLVLNEALRQT
jgi:hypothetical protein